MAGTGRVLREAVLWVKSWSNDMVSHELLLKVDIANAYNTISRGACMDGVKKLARDRMVGALVLERRKPGLLLRPCDPVHCGRATGGPAGSRIIFTGPPLRHRATHRKPGHPPNFVPR